MIHTPWPWQKEEDPRENSTGIYRFDPDSGRVEKVSDCVPKYVFDCFCPRGGYWSENMGNEPIFVESRSHKRRLLKERGLKEHVKSLSRREL